MEDLNAKQTRNNVVSNTIVCVLFVVLRVFLVLFLFGAILCSIDRIALRLLLNASRRRDGCSWHSGFPASAFTELHFLRLSALQTCVTQNRFVSAGCRNHQHTPN
jgi:hypothetical protein